MPIDSHQAWCLRSSFLAFFTAFFSFTVFAGSFLPSFLVSWLLAMIYPSRVEKIEFYLARGIKLKPRGFGEFTPVGRYVMIVYLCKMSFSAKHLVVRLLRRLTRLIKYGNYSFFTSCRYAVIDTNFKRLSLPTNDD